MNFIDGFDFSKYFKKEGDGKRAKIGHVNAVVKELNAITEEFLILSVLDDAILFKKDKLINGKTSWVFTSWVFIEKEDEQPITITIHWDIDTTSWVLLLGEVVMGSMIDNGDNENPYSGLYGSFNITIVHFLGTTQEIIEKLAQLIVENNNNQLLESSTYLDSAAILTLGSIPVQILPPAGIDSYYDIEKIIIEFAAGSTVYDNLGLINLFYSSTGDNVFSTEADKLLGVLDYSIIKTAASGSYINGASDSVLVPTFKKNDSLFLKTTNDSGASLDPTLGDGVLEITVFYKIRKFSSF